MNFYSITTAAVAMELKLNEVKLNTRFLKKI